MRIADNNNNAQTAGFRFPVLQRNDGRVSVQQLSEQQYQQGFADGSAATEQEAYQRGLADGQQMAQAQAARELAQQQQHWQQQQQQALDLLVDAFHQQLAQQDLQLANELGLLVQRLAATVIAAELTLQPTLFADIVSRLCGTLSAAEPLQSIVLAQADAALFAGVSQIGQVPLRFDEAQPSGQVQFIANQQLHQLDFNSRLAQAMQPVWQALTGGQQPLTSAGQDFVGPSTANTSGSYA